MNAQARSALAGSGGGASGRRRVSAGVLGAVVLALIALAAAGAFFKDSISTALSTNPTIKAEFPRQYKLINDSTYVSDVKMSGVIVGKVTDVSRTDRGTAMVSMQVQDQVLDKLGAKPTAKIRPTLIVGGIYYVGLTPSGAGEFDGPIPVSRTQVPVELDNVLNSVSSEPAKAGIQAAIGQTNSTLRQGGREAARGLVANAPGTLRPAGTVLDAARGTRPDTDLARLVDGLDSTATAFTREQGQLAAILESLNTSTAALAAQSEPLAESISTGPETLRVTRVGLADLQPTLDELTTTAQEFRPSARQLGSFLEELNPVLQRTRPVVNDLRFLSRDARPLVDRLVPTAGQATTALDDVRGPVLSRINGPIKNVLFSDWHGTGAYEGGGNNHPLYKEIGYLATDIAEVMDGHDGTVTFGRLEAGAGGRSVGGGDFPESMEQILERFRQDSPKGPQQGANDGRDRTGGSGGVVPVPYDSLEPLDDVLQAPAQPLFGESGGQR